MDSSRYNVILLICGSLLSNLVMSLLGRDVEFGMSFTLGMCGGLAFCELRHRIAGDRGEANR